MIGNILLIVFALILGYLVFMSSAYLLAKWLLPKIDDDDRADASERIARTARDGRYIAQ